MFVLTNPIGALTVVSALWVHEWIRFRAPGPLPARWIGAMRQSRQVNGDMMGRAIGCGEALRLRRRLGRLGYLIAIFGRTDENRPLRRGGAPRLGQIVGRRTGAS